MRFPTVSGIHVNRRVSKLLVQNFKEKQGLFTARNLLIYKPLQGDCSAMMIQFTCTWTAEVHDDLPQFITASQFCKADQYACNICNTL